MEMATLAREPLCQKLFFIILDIGVKSGRKEFVPEVGRPYFQRGLVDRKSKRKSQQLSPKNGRKSVVCFPFP